MHATITVYLASTYTVAMSHFAENGLRWFGRRRLAFVVRIFYRLRHFPGRQITDFCFGVMFERFIVT